MKKSKVGQATLFQSWGRPAQQPSNSASRILNSNRTSQPQNGVYSAFDPNDIVDLGDEDDDDELLAAAEGIAHCDEANFQTSVGQANATTHISCDPDEIEVIPGFDLEAGNVWVYPTNYPIRNYQYDIVEQALFKNTLVTLPTGLGKTFIAAVVMYNFYRWYPQGKVIFMAPTKPLVAQQIEACFNIMGIPQSDTAEMTGNMAPNKRQSLWQSRRVFFLTPQVLQNDLNRGSCKAEEVVLLVADEAHKALGNHAYCQVVREISGYTRNFRVLALSATPGDALESVQQVITNLLISHMELRSEESPDIQPYTHSRQVEKVVVSLGEDISKIKASYLKVLEAVVGRLFCQRALWQRDPQRVTKFLLLSARDQFRKRMNEQGGLDRNQQSRIEGDFAMCISLYHAYELLLQHGILSFYNFIKGIMDGTKGMARAKTEITKNHEFSQLMDELREEIEPPMENSANESLLFSQFSPRRRALMNVPKPSTTFKSHPKLMKLKEIVLEHFQKFQDKSGADSKGVTTRVMIFSQYRDSVNEIAAMLAQHKPLVRVMSFIGQQSTGKSSRGLTQKEQLQVVQRFRQGGYNTLVATCVGEEGLDIGEVDLIVCFDAHASPIRLVQRMGRTGRKRDGRIVILVTEGKEEQVYQRSQRSKNSIHKAVKQAAKSFDLYADNHRMVPRQLTPAVLKMEMTVGKFQAQSKGKKKGRPSDGADIKNFTSKSATTTLKKSDGFLTYEELVYWQEHFKLPDHEAGLSPQLSVTKRSRRSLSEAKKPVTQPSLTEWLPWQTTLHPVKAVTHSRRTEHLVELLEFTELHGGQGDSDESYDLEMMSFLNDEDILKPGQMEGDVGEVGAGENVVGREENEGTSKIAKKGKKSRKKLQMEAESDAKDGGQNSRKEDLDGGTSGKRNAKGVKKRSPENKARWKDFLKQFDNKDEDFESDGANETAGQSNGNIVVEDELQTHDNAELESDLPDAGEPYEQADKTMEDGIDKIRLQQGYNETNNEPVTLKETERVLESESGNLSDAASDDFSNLFPTATPDFHGFNSAFKVQRTRFASTMASVPTPPSLDALDKINLSQASEELDEFCMETEEEAQRELRKNPIAKVDKFDISSVVSSTKSPKACFENHSEIEPFLMADFLEDDDDAKAEIEANKSNSLKSSRLEKEDRITSTPKNSSVACVDTLAEIHVSKAEHEEKRNPVIRPCKSVSSTDNFDSFGIKINEAQNLREIANDGKACGVTKDGDTREISKKAGTSSKDLNPKTDAQNDFGFGVWCGNPINEFNEREGEEVFPQEDAAFAEAFFMDETDDDDAFTNLTLPGDDNVTEKDTENDHSNLAEGQELIAQGELSRSIPCKGKDSKGRNAEIKIKTSKQVCESKEIETNVPRKNIGSSVAIDLRASIGKLSAFQHNSTDEKTSSTLVSNFTRNPESDSREKSKVYEEINSRLTEGALPMKTAKPLPGVRTRGEHSSTTDLHNGAGMLDGSRNSVAVPPVSTTISPRHASSKHPRDISRDGMSSRDGLPSLDGDGELFEKEPNLTGVRNRVKVANENNYVNNDAGNSVGNNTSDSAGGYTGCNIDTSNTGDNVCRSPVPKKLKLSRKRTSPKDKGMLATKIQANQAKSLDFGSSYKKGDLGGKNLDVLIENSSSRSTDSRNFEIADKQVLSMVADDCSVNLSHLRTHNGAVVAVMESEDEGDDEDDDEDVVRPVRKTISLRRQALSSPCSQERFKRPANPEKHRGIQPDRLSSRVRQLGSESDEEFEVDKSVRSWSESSKACQEKPRTEKRKSLEIGGKQGTRKSLESLRKKNNKPRKSHFLDDEAELSGSDINDFPSDDEEHEDEDEMDSFIDDSTQLTQRTPSTARPRHASSPMDMMAVYRQSLRSPLSGALNFKTPLFHKQRNKYKMVYKHTTVNEDSESDSEAEETYESESILENEVEEENESEAWNPHENETEIMYESEVSCRSRSDSDHMKSLSRADKSFEESQIGRPVKRMKRKRILDDTFAEEVSPKLSKQRNLSETCEKENKIEETLRRTCSDTTHLRPPPQRKTDAFGGNCSAKSKFTGNNIRSDFVKSSDVLGDERNHQDNHSALQRSAGNRESMRRSGSFVDDWNNDISDSELLVALEGEGKTASIKKPPPSNIFQDQDLNEIAVAMELTDEAVAMEVNELPTFSLGFDFLSETIFTNNASTGDGNSSKANSGTLTERQNENCCRKPNFAVPNRSSNTRNSTGISNGRTLSSSSKDGGTSHEAEHFTKIVQCSKQTLDSSYQTGNETSAKRASCLVSQSISIAPQKAAKPITSSTSSLISNQRPVSNNLLTTRTKIVAESEGPRSVAHAKLQVVTPSCRPNPPVSRPAISPLTSSQKDKGKTTILVDSREISSSQVVSLLRLKHNIKAEVCQLTSGDYIVSNRMAVKRKTASDVANGSNSPKLIECMRRMCDLYDRPCLIIEKDRVKPGETDKNFIKTKAYIFTLASIAQTHVKMMFSDSQEETAALLTELAAIEAKKGTAITAPTSFSKEREQVFRVALSIPRVSYIAALNLCSSFSSLYEIINSSPAELERRTPGLSSPRTAEIHKCLRHKFNPEMVAAKK